MVYTGLLSRSRTGFMLPKYRSRVCVCACLLIARTLTPEYCTFMGERIDDLTRVT